MNRHPFRWGSAVFGLAFAAVVAAWVVLELELLDVDTAGVAVAATLIVLGVLGIVGTVIASRRPSVPGPTEAPNDDDTNDDDTNDENTDDTMGAEATDGTEEVPDEREEAPTQR